MAAEKTVSGIFVGIDEILDTRLAILHEMGPQALKSAMDNDYYTRAIDMFPGVDYEEFKRRYKERNKQTLRNAVVTNISKLVEEFSMKTHQNVLNSPFHMVPKIIVNTWPYVLTPDEEFVIMGVVRAWGRMITDVQVVHMPYSAITPQYLSAHVSTLVLYEYDQWLEAQTVSDAFRKHTCPDVTLFAPMIAFKKPDRTLGPDENPFIEMERLAAPYIGLKFLPVDSFSIAVKLEKGTT
jgi:hypothetical protein